MRIGLLPVFNEEKNIVYVLNKLEKQLDYIVIVDDGSFDKTEVLISNWMQNKKNIAYFSHENNIGMSYALLQGFKFIYDQGKKMRFSDTDVIITLDADGQHNPDEVKNMCAYFEKNNLDLLIARRIFLNYPRYRILGNKIISMFASLLGGFRFKDIECGFKIFKASFLSDLLYYYIGIRYSCAGEIGVIASLRGYKIDNSYAIEVPYYKKKGPGLKDFFINLILCFLVASKINMKKNIKSKFHNQKVLINDATE